MKRLALLAALALLAPATRAAEPALEFIDVLAFPGKTLVALRDRPDAPAQWIEPGTTFAGHRVMSYDAKDETVLLTRDGTSLRLRLADTKIASALAPDLHHLPLDARRQVWARLKDLTGQPLVEALVRSGDRTMRGIVEKIRDSSLRLQASRAQVATALAQPGMSARKRSALQESDETLVARLNESQALLDQSALALKSILEHSLRP